MRKVYLIAVIVLAAGLIGLGFWYRSVGAPTHLIADLLPGVESRPEATVTFAVIGDNEDGNPAYRSLVQQIVKNPDVQFLLHVGDLVAHGGAAELAASQALHAELGLQVPMYAVPGNHDIINDPERVDFMAALGAIPRSIDVGHVHLVLLDNANRKIGFPDTELAWLETDLTAWEQRKPMDGQTILAYHRPFAYPLASILGDDETRTSRASNERFLAILNQHDIDHIFTGHVHTAINYAMITSPEGAPVRTVPVTVSGGGGQPLQAAFGSFLHTKYHALIVEVRGKKIQTKLLLPET